jgi:NADH-quinone oxidoreductase subunit C
MEMEKKKILEDLQNKFPEGILSLTEQLGDDIILIKKESLPGIVRFLKDDPYAFTMLLDLTCVDYLGDKDRYEMVYHIFSLSNKLRLRIKARLAEKDPGIDSLTSIFKNANWLEREAYDMFGVDFKGHPYLRRLFMYDGFEGHPLRKDYPLRKQQPKIRLRNE